MCPASRGGGNQPGCGICCRSIMFQSITCSNVIVHTVVDELIHRRTFVLCKNFEGSDCCHGARCKTSNDCDHNDFNSQRNFHLMVLFHFMYIGYGMEIDMILGQLLK